jgi:uncharacterized small protein (DUF1192 family)
MTANDRIALTLGRLVIQVETLGTTVEALTAENARLKAQVAEAAKGALAAEAVKTAMAAAPAVRADVA